MLRIALLFVTLLLTGCGTYYDVSVDSLRDFQLAPLSANCFVEPGQKNTVDDLVFRDVERLLHQPLSSLGYSVVKDPKNADVIIKVSVWQENPKITMTNSTRYRKEPVVVRDGTKTKVQYVSVEEPMVNISTKYPAKLLIEAYLTGKKGRTQELIWRTQVIGNGTDENFRGLLAAMTYALPGLMGNQTPGLMGFDVFVGDDGKIEVNPK